MAQPRHEERASGGGARGRRDVLAGERSSEVDLPPAYEELRRRLGEVYDLWTAAGLAGWDQRTQMPPAGAAVRAEQRGTLSRLAHERFVSDEVGLLLEDLAQLEESLDYDSLEASLIRVTRRDYEKFRRVPSELRAELSRAAALGESVWERARAESDFPKFLPCLERNLELKREYIACFDPADEDYDHLLDDYERGMKTAEVRTLFESLKQGLVPLIEQVAAVDGVDDSCLRATWPLDGQKRFERKVLDAFGFDEASWRLDETAHPFASNMAIADIRLTTRHHEDNLTSLFAVMHEFGHGLYERQVDPALERSPLARGASLGVHESQSRLWENQVGRSMPFWRHFYPDLQDTFHEQLGGVSLDTFYRAVNKVQPSLIRIYADEATYNLHIILRFELEQDLLSGALAAAEVPDAWNAKMQEYLGIEPEDVADGAMQDTHWASGLIGYFATYTLGNMISAQLWEKVLEDVPDLHEQMEQGEFTGLREWLREQLHRHGRKFPPGETLERAVGAPIDPAPYLRYLRGKVSEIYGIAA
ncbi:MAG: carboxypeptidase [Candidatus Rokuibacteriota bacterium]|nr:MAG: carboxypeptidase [Candidatus Rokubacteria bacterium]